MMDLVSAAFHAAAQSLQYGGHNSYLAFSQFKRLSKIQQDLIDDFFSILLGSSFTELLDKCGGKIPFPMTRSIDITWTIEHVKKVRPELSDEQASIVLTVMDFDHDRLIKSDSDFIGQISKKLFPLDYDSNFGEANNG